MLDAPRRFETMVAWAGRLIVAGLVLQLATCFWLNALAFVLFLALGGALVGSGSLLFLYWLATGGDASSATSPTTTRGSTTQTP